MTMNSRPIDNPRLQKALDECRKVFARYGYAGCAMVISPDEAAFFYAMHAPWSAIRYDPNSPLGWRFTAVASEVGAKQAHALVEGGLHTICQLSDFGAQTMDWMEQVKAMLRVHGIEFEHTPFNGEPLPGLTLRDGRKE